MKRRLGRLLVFAGVVGLLLVLNVGVASATHGENAEPFEVADTLVGPAATATTPVNAPVGSHILGADTPGHPGADNGFGRIHVVGGENDGDEIPGPGGTDFGNPAVMALANNPNCPLHYPPPA